jgi:hypothetical protein
MRDITDTVTMTIDGLPPAPLPRGRRAVYATSAEKQKAYRERKNIVAVTVNLPAALAAELDAWLVAKGKKKSAVIEKLIRTQLLRPR